MKSICLFAVLSIAAMTGIGAAAYGQQAIPGNDAAAAKIAKGDSLCIEMLTRMNRRLNTDSINLVISKIERWPEKAMSPQYIKYRDNNRPMLLKYEDYNKETIGFISYFINSIDRAEKKRQSDDKKFKEYLAHVFSKLTETGRFQNTAYSYGPVFHNRNNAPSLPYINDRLEKMRSIIRNYNIANPSATVKALKELREEFTPVPSQEEIKRQKHDKEMIDNRNIATSVFVPSAPNLDAMPDVPEIEIIKGTISKIENIQQTLDEWSRNGYPQELIYKLRNITDDELDKARKKLEEKVNN